MRSKTRARKLTSSSDRGRKEDTGVTSDHNDTGQLDGNFDCSDQNYVNDHQSDTFHHINYYERFRISMVTKDGVSPSSATDTDESRFSLTSETSQESQLSQESPVNIESSLPREICLRKSGVCSGFGVYAVDDIAAGFRFGPQSVEDGSVSAECLHDVRADWTNRRRHWTSYVHKADFNGSIYNVREVQLGNQVYLEAVSRIAAGEEILLGTSDARREARCSTSDGQRAGSTHLPGVPGRGCGQQFVPEFGWNQHDKFGCRSRFGPERPHAPAQPTSDSQNHLPPTRDIPLKSQVQEMIQDSPHSLERPSPSQRPAHTHDSTDTHDITSAHNISHADLFNHKLSSSLSSLKKFPCENCNRAFSSPIELQRHIRTVHVGARSHTCPDCGKTFATSSGLKQHQHIHSSIKPFQCEVCLKAYTQFSNLCRHKRMHADCRQQIKCKDCGQAFSTMTSLGKHKRFCQGMLSNGNGRIANYHNAHPSLVPEKSCGMQNPSKMSSAFTNPYTFYGPRAPFPFFPPVGAGFPMFPQGHSMSPMVSASMHDKKMADIRELPEVKHDCADSDSEERRIRWGSDHSSMSTTSDLAKSDIESGSESEHNFRNGLCESPRSLKTSSPAMASPASSKTSLHEFSHKRRRSMSGSERPFDLSKTVSPAHDRRSDSKSESGYIEQPLDLSFKSSKEETPRKTHIFGASHTNSTREIRMRERPSALPTPPNKPTSPIPAPVVLSPRASLSIEVPEKMHEAYPATSASQMMLSRMYGSGALEKTGLEMYHEAARFMSMVPSRFAFPGMPSPFSPFSGPMPGMFPPSSLDQGKAMGNGFMRSHASPFPYTPGMKLKDRYTCKFCGKIFPRSANLTRHLRTHTGEQPYKCKYCERSFSISSNLQRHIRNIHNKEKPFKCPICDRCFGQQTNLDRHLKKHEYEGPIVADSPLNDDVDCDDINPINGELGSTGSSGHASDLSSPLKEDRDVIDSAFSITGRMQKVEPSQTPDGKNLDESVEHSEDELEWENHDRRGDGDRRENHDTREDSDDTRQSKHLNNNLPNENFNHRVMNLSGASS